MLRTPNIRMMIGCFGMLAAANGSVARGDLVLTFDLASANFRYDVGALHADVTNDNFSDLRLFKIDSDTLTTLDGALVSNGDFDFRLSLDFVDGAGANNWSAMGDVQWTDLDQSTSAMEASFTSTSVLIDPVTNSLQITGVLAPLSGSGLLVNRGDPWIFDGSESSTAANEDGVVGNLFIANPDFYSAGSLTTLKFGLGPGMTLDTLFSESRELLGGNVKGSIIPAPGAALLGALGLSLVILWKKRATHSVPSLSEAQR